MRALFVDNPKESQTRKSWKLKTRSQCCVKAFRRAGAGNKTV
jgi:hypothetical protein